MAMGTFREKLGDSTEYRGEDAAGGGGDDSKPSSRMIPAAGRAPPAENDKNGNEKAANKVVGGATSEQLIWGAKSYLRLPRADAQSVYNFLCLALAVLWTVAMLYPADVVARGERFYRPPNNINNLPWVGNIVGTGRSGIVGDAVAVTVSHGPVLAAML